jgi:predicted RNA binding protein with dsRBD fold (UPF0201 family)
MGWLSDWFNKQVEVSAPLPMLTEPIDYNNSAHIKYAQDCLAIIRSEKFNHRTCANFSIWLASIGDAKKFIKLAETLSDQEILNAKRNAYMKGESWNT